MAQGYYTLEEAAKILGTSVDELKQLARKGEVRSFQDRGTWRFRVQDIQEMARRRGQGSDPDLVLGESLQPRPVDSGPKTPLATPKSALGPRSGTGSGPRSGAGSGPKSGAGGEAFDFTLEPEDSATEVGREPARHGSSKKNPTPTPAPGSDSDVRLVPDDDAFDFQIDVDSDVKMVDTPQPGPQGAKSGPGKTGLGPPSPSRPSKLAGPASPSRPSKLGGPGSGPKHSKLAGPGSSAQRQSKLANPGSGSRPSKLDVPRKTGLGSGPVDSGVRLVPMDSDSDVRIIPPDDSNEVALGQQPPRSATDSDIRLELDGPAAGAGEPSGMLTEEINLDEELRREEAARSQTSPQSKIRPKAGGAPQLPTTSPFELNESELRLPESETFQPPVKDDSSDFDLTPIGESSSPLETGSSDFDLTPQGQSDSPLEGAASDEFTLELPDDSDEAASGGPPSGLKGPASGISLDQPLDSGISLEQGGDGSDEIEFTLNLDDEATPKPASATPSVEDSSSEFELALDGGAASAADAGNSSEFELSLELDDEPKQAAEGEDPSSSEFELTLDSGEGPAPAADDSSSEFELTLDSGEEAAPAADDSDSEFELTLDDSGSVSALEEGAAEDADEEKDIFETDFEVPALDEESGSEAVALEDSDADMESSDFDLALDDQDVADDDQESGSQVVALDEDEADDSAATVAGKSRSGRAAPPLEEEDAGFDELAGEIGEAVQDEPEEEEEELVGAGAAVAAPWGALPVVFMLPCVVVMFLVGVMGFELVQSMTSYKPPGMVTKAITDLVKSK